MPMYGGGGGGDDNGRKMMAHRTRTSTFWFMIEWYVQRYKAETKDVDNWIANDEKEKKEAVQCEPHSTHTQPTESVRANENYPKTEIYRHI